MIKPLKVLCCGLSFPFAFKLIQSELIRRNIPSTDIILKQCLDSSVAREIQDFHVVLPFMTQINKTMIESSPELKYIMQFGAGLEGVDIAAATKRKIYVGNIPSRVSGNAEATAEHAIFLMLSALRNSHLTKDVFSQKLLGAPLSRQLSNKKIALFGFGDVGKEIVARLVSFKPANVTVFKRQDLCSSEFDRFSALAKFFQTDLQFFTGLKDDLFNSLSDKDIVILAVPLTSETRGMVSEKFLKSLKKDSIIVNIARGQLVHNEALLAALDDNISVYASDVGASVHGKSLFELCEPFPPEDLLAKHPRVILTPHNGGVADVSYQNMAGVAVDNFISLLENGKPRHEPVNRF